MKMTRVRKWLVGTGWLARLALAVCGLGTGVPAALAAEYQRAPVPPWVVAVPLDLEATPPPGQAKNGLYHLLIDQQTLLDGSTRTSYRRMASRALSERGVESIAHIGIDFDPSFQKLTLHALTLHRNGRAQNRLASARIQVLQREAELEYRIYDGTKTVDVVLADVRPGDVVEYAYSVRGSNPVFGGRESGQMDMQWRVPVHRLHRRLRAPAGMELKFRPHLTHIQAQITQSAGWVDHVWQATDVAPMARQNDTPGWYDPYAAIQWSAFAGWSAVARWAEPLYAEPNHHTAALGTEIDRIAAQSREPGQRLLGVLDFVQSQIRYLGVEMGPGSHAPRAPGKVLEQRYGDCKDKALLTVTMLRALGVTAHPALVNTQLRQGVATLLPMPGAFDHVIVRAQVDGHDYWLDPTRAPQKGGLDRISQADFGQALVLDGKATALTPIPTAPAAQWRRQVAFHIDASQGFDKPASMEVTSTYEGISADRMRGTLRNESADDLQRDYLNYYLRSYPRLALVKPFTVSDDEASNQLVVVEHYRIASLWAEPVPTGGPVVYLYAPEMKSVLKRPDDTVRTAPLAIDHPEQLTVNVTAVLPEKRSIAAAHGEVRNPAFTFNWATSYSDRTLQLTYGYRSLADHVTPDQLAAYLADLESARKTVGYTLRKRAPKPGSEPLSRLAAALAGALFLAFGLLAIAATWVTRKTRLPAADTGSGRYSHRQLLGTGVFVSWLPVLASLSFVGMVWALAGNLEFFGWGTVLIVFLLASTWQRYWHARWLLWASSHAIDTEQFIGKARSLGLVGRSSIPPPQTASASAPAEREAGSH